MNLETITDDKATALAKWREYQLAEKQQRRKNKSLALMYKDMKRVYWQIKNGKKIIDIHKIIQTGGIHPNHHPKLAITSILAKTVQCTYLQNGKVVFRPSGTDFNWRTESKMCVELDDCLPKYKALEVWQRFDLTAPVPIVPPQFVPKIITNDYYILWEVDKWKMTPPTDPYLLRRINKTLFVVLEGWDLTEVEKAVMQSYLR